MNDPQFFLQSIRISIASYILERTRFTGILDVSNLSRNVVGIEKLLQDKVFRAAFPLHDVSSGIYSLLNDEKNDVIFTYKG